MPADNAAFTSAEVSGLIAGLLANVRVSGGVEDGAYTLKQVSERTGFAYSSLVLGCRDDTIEHAKFGDARCMTPSQVAKLLKRCTRGGDLAEQIAESVTHDPSDEMAQARAASAKAAARSPRRKDVAA